MKLIDASAQIGSISLTDFYTPPATGTYQVTLVTTVTTVGTAGTLQSYLCWAQGNSCANTTVVPGSVALTQINASQTLRVLINVNTIATDHFYYQVTMAANTGSPQFRTQVFIKRID